jgi:hypothetical protein
MTSGGNSGSGSGGKGGVSLLGKVIIGSIPVLALSISFVQLWTGGELLCKLTWDWLKVDFFKCPDETKPANTPETKTDKTLPDTQTPQGPSTPTLTPEPITPSTETPNNPIKPTPIKPNPSNNTTKFDIGVLNGNQEYQDRVSYEIQEKYYFFRIDKNSNVKLYLDGVTSEVGMWLYVDTNGNGEIDNGEELASVSAYSSRSGIINQNLAADTYIVKVKFQRQNSDYNIQLVNQTSLTKNIGLLQENKIDKGFLNRDNRVQYYQFTLSETKNVRLSLSDVTSQVGMFLYADKNANGVINDNEQLGSVSAYSSRAGEIRQDLAPDNYFLVISKEQQNTEYTLNLFLQ